LNRHQRITKFHLSVKLKGVDSIARYCPPQTTASPSWLELIGLQSVQFSSQYVFLSYSISDLTFGQRGSFIFGSSRGTPQTPTPNAAASFFLSFFLSFFSQPVGIAAAASSQKTLIYTRSYIRFTSDAAAARGAVCLTNGGSSRTADK
jgi:hypothetical protein